MLKAQTCEGERQSVFKIIKGNRLSVKLIDSSLEFKSHFRDMNGCVSYCLANSSCVSGNFRISTGDCSLFEFNSWETEFNIVSDTDYIILQKMGETFVTHGEWTLVFRGVANINKPVYDAYIDTSLYNDQPLTPMYPIGCLRLDTNLLCDQHFRSKLLNSWENLNITEVKFTVYKDGFLQKFILFNGTSSSLLTWFSSANLIKSSWDDLSMSPNAAFSIFGPKYLISKRRFYIEYNIHSGCDFDRSWFVCVDQVNDGCPWGRPVPNFPRFLFSSTNTMAHNKDMLLADVIAIFIKF